MNEDSIIDKLITEKRLRKKQLKELECCGNCKHYKTYYPANVCLLQELCVSGDNLCDAWEIKLKRSK